MLTVLAMTLALAAPGGGATPPISLEAPGSKGFMALGHVNDPGHEQTGFADNATIRRTGDVVELWENWVLDSPVLTERGEVSFLRRRYRLDCVARTSQMAQVQVFTADGRLIDDQAVPQSSALTPPPAGSIAAFSVTFYCDNAPLPFERLDFATWDEAYREARRQYAAKP